LVIVGGSSFSDGYADSLRRLAEQDPRILFTGYAYEETLEELYSNAAAFVLPSVLEGLPLTLLEAASYGTPVVVSDIAPHVEVVRVDAIGHHTFRVGDEGALAEVIRRTIRDRRREREGARRFSAQVADSYRWDDVVQATEDIYRSLLDDRQRVLARRHRP
jgi:glycosyltransferase involved in cell wall biosynthesis